MVSRSTPEKMSDVTATTKPGRHIGGIGGRTRVTEWATLTFYCRRVAPDGTAGTAQFTASAWVVDQLAVPYFLGNAFLHPHRIDISARKQCLDIEVLDVLEIPTRIIHEGRPVTRRAAATAVTAIPPGQTRVIAARWKDLPKGRVFVSDPIHPAAAAVFVDADTPRVIQMTNSTKEAIRIGKDARLGQIRDNEGIDMLSATGVTLAAAAVTGQLTGQSTAPARSHVPVGYNPSLDLDPNPGPVEVDYGDLSDDPIYDVEQLMDRWQYRG